MKFYSSASALKVCLTGSLAVILLTISTSPVQAQPQTGTNVQTRFLLIFDTSSAMGKRLESEKVQIDALLAGKLGGYLKDEDTIGVWTFDKELHTGDLPLQRWSAKNSALVADNIKTFLERQSYGHSTSFKALQPYLNEVVASSAQLIVIIFSDGEGKFTGTPFDQHIDDVFEKQKSALRKAKQPFELVFCAQRGEYTGANLGLPPGIVNIPELPPWPQPPAPTNPPPVVVEKPPVLLPPLIIVGTHHTNPPPQVVVPPPQVVTPPPAAVTLPQPTTETAAPTTEEVQSNLPATTVSETAAPIVNRTPDASPATPPVEAAPAPDVQPAPAAASTTTPVSTPKPDAPPAANPVAATTVATPAVATPTSEAVPTNSSVPMVAVAGEPVTLGNAKLLIGIGIGLLISACALGVLLLFRSRRPHSSLISDSMRNK